MHVGAVDEIADPDRGADAVEREALEMIDQVGAGEGLLRHRPGGNILEAEMAVHVDQRRHHRLAGEVDACRAGRRLHLAAPADRGEAVVLDDEGRVLDRRAAVAGDEPRALEHSRRLRQRRARGHREGGDISVDAISFARMVSSEG